MTQNPAPIQPPEPPPVQVQATAGSRLEQLHEAYAAAKAAANDAEKALKAITDGIKLELSQLAPEGSTKVDLIGKGTPLRLGWTETWRFDSTRFKQDDPVTYVRYAKKSGTWSLRPISNGGEQS